MKILVTNDDGIFARGLSTLVRELKKIADVAVAAPDREQSATGSSVTLRHPLRVQKMLPMVPDVETYSIEGTPSDSVILTLGKLVQGPVDMVISGINQGANLGDDVLISGTVSAALQGYLHGFPALAISLALGDDGHLDNAARLAALLAKRVLSNGSSPNIFLNVNLPNLPLEKIKGVKITRLANKSHIDTVKEGHDGIREYYWLVRQRLNNGAAEGTDIWAMENDYISITPLHRRFFSKPSPSSQNGLYHGLFDELKGSETRAI